MTAKPTPNNDEALRHLYFDTALQYHVAARFAAIAGFLPVAGNLFHHAIEMYIKGYLAKFLTERQRRDLGHNLPRVWEEFKKQVADPKLNAFDQAIAKVDAFEDIRYPEEIIAKGLSAVIDFGPRLPGPTTSLTHELNVTELDEVCRAICQAHKLNLRAFTGSMRRDAIEYLTRWNESFLSKQEAENRIRMLAYQKYVSRGMANGHALDDWLAAELELKERLDIV